MGDVIDPKETLPSQSDLRLLLDYEPQTGVLTWKARGSEWFEPGEYSPERQAATWNGKNAGKPALVGLNTNGYMRGGLFGRSVRAHRVIWKWMTGEEPEAIDHISGIRTDNRWSNLRAATKTDNARNMCRSKRNTSGVVGVVWLEDRQKWRAEICANSRRRTIGAFDDKQEAITARRAAERDYGYHPNHGRVANG